MVLYRKDIETVMHTQDARYDFDYMVKASWKGDKEFATLHYGVSYADDNMSQFHEHGFGQ